MSELKERIYNLLDDLQRERDELQVKIHLAKLEASDEWQEVEEKLQKLRSKAKSVGDATAESSKEIGAATKLLGEEIRDGFKRVTKRL